MSATVEIVRKEMIKPSSPTPHHLKQHKFSFLDQIAASVYIRFIFFYEATNQKYSCQLLKNSLSKALTFYYPLAGRAINDDNYYIHCNDAGALFVEAKVLDVDFLKFIENPDMDFINQLVPLYHINGDHEEVILAVQINLFSCGGIAIGVEMFHKIGDVNSLVNFMNAWGAICRGRDDIELMMNPPRFDIASKIFPQRDLSGLCFKPKTFGITKENIVTKRLVFDKEKLDNLKQVVVASSSNIVDNPTRVEVVTALIWKHLMDVTKRKLVAAHVVNLRPRMINPTIPDNTFGNILTRTVAAQPMKEEGEYTNGILVGKLRVAIKSINEDYVKNKIQNEADEYLNNLFSIAESVSKREIDVYNFSSWCRFPVYEVDYGWGKPVWVTTTTVPYKNVAILMSTKNGDGIEVLINMLEEDASIFDTDHNLVPVAATVTVTATGPNEVSVGKF